MGVPFTPKPHSTVRVSLGSDTQTIAVNTVSTVWIDNRGGSDVMVEFFDAPDESNSYRITGFSSQPLTRPASASMLYIARPDGSPAEDVFVSLGYGD